MPTNKICCGVIVLITMHGLTLGYKIFLRRAPFHCYGIYTTIVTTVALKKIVSYSLKIAVLGACYYHLSFTGSINRFIVSIAVAPNFFGAAYKLLGSKWFIVGAMDAAVA